MELTTEGETWKVVKAEVRAKRKKNAAAYLELLQKSGIPFEISNRGETLIFRPSNRPNVLFWPATGKWRVSKPGAKTFNGGATSFLSWYWETFRLERR